MASGAGKQPGSAAGEGELVLRRRDHFDPGAAPLSAEDYFVLTRIDGRTSLHELCLISGFSKERTLAIVEKLRRAGAVLSPGDAAPASGPTPPPAVTKANPAAKADSAAKVGEAGAAAANLALTPEEEALFAMPSALSDDQKRAVLLKARVVRQATLFEFLGVAQDADRTALKRAYFKVSKEFHPDRYFGKELGIFREPIAQLFEHATKAFEILSDEDKRAAYLEQLALRQGRQGVGGGTVAVASSGVTSGSFATASRQTTRGTSAGGLRSLGAQAAEAFEAACQHQVIGELERALQEFAEVARLDPQPRYLCRAADAAMQAGQLSLAEEYAKRAAEIDDKNANVRRTLGRTHRAAGRVLEARHEFAAALKLDPDNQFIAAELEALDDGK